MDLLGNNESNKQESKSKKMVGTLLVISIIALILVVLLIMFLKANQPKNITYKLSIDDQDNNSTIIQTPEGKYVALEDVAQNIGYTYYNGEYLGQATEERENCYLKNKDEVICFKINTMEVYKTTEDSIVEKQMYKAKNNIINNENKICIAIEDLGTIFNTKINYDEKNYKINVYTKENLAKTYKNEISSKKLLINLDESFENLKAISKDMLVITKDGQYGVVDKSFNTIIGNKYTSMEYDEYTNTFIVSDSNNKYGVLTDKGDSKINLKYDNIFIISYEPLLYAVTKNQKYGVINEKENVIINIEYDKLSCAGDTKNNIESVLIIPKVHDNEDGIVVCKDSKYGIVNLLTGEDIIPCNADKINSRTKDNGEREYFVVIEEKEIELKKYIKAVNTTTINLSNTIKNQVEE